MPTSLRHQAELPNLMCFMFHLPIGLKLDQASGGSSHVIYVATPLWTFPKSDSLRVLCLDGGGVKGYTTLLVLRRIMRTLRLAGGFKDDPRPCDVFDLIAGTSTGGSIAVMLGKLKLSIDECLGCYEKVGREVFGPSSGRGSLRRLIKGVRSSAFYDIRILQEEIRKILDDQKDVDREQIFCEEQDPGCKVMVCVLRTATSKPNVLRNYYTGASTQENHRCKTWEAASATAAAPIYFDNVVFEGSKTKWADGGSRRNNPINEALAEIERHPQWSSKKIGCVVSLGTGVAKITSLPSNLVKFLQKSADIMTDADQIASDFASSKEGRTLAESNRYFRFSVPQGLAEMELDEYDQIELMDALTSHYLSQVGSGREVERCAQSLLKPDGNLVAKPTSRPSLLPYRVCAHFVSRAAHEETLLRFFSTYHDRQQIFVISGLGGIGTKELLEASAREWLLVLDNADHLEEFLPDSDTSTAINEFLPAIGRILITTRDRRFQGLLSAASDCIQLEPMNDDEGEELLRKSIHPNLLSNSKPAGQAALEELLHELGNLPLAIAQAAANIRDRQLSLVQYVAAYSDRRQRMGLMRLPARDLQSTDPRTRSQFISITCEISFAYLERQYPLSAICMCYMGFFDNKCIQRKFLKNLAEFTELDDLAFQDVIKRLLHLSLAEEHPNEDKDQDLTEYQVHPVIHERIFTRLEGSKAIRFAQPVIDTLSAVLPFHWYASQPELDSYGYWPPHAMLLADRIRSLECISRGAAQLFVALAVYMNGRGLGNLAQ